MFHVWQVVDTIILNVHYYYAFPFPSNKNDSKFASSVCIKNYVLVRYPKLEPKAPNTKEFLFLTVNSVSHLPNLIISFTNSISSCRILRAIGLPLVFATVIS